MGSLSNLYISQSYQSLIHLATNDTASATLIELQDGLGNSIGVAVNTAGDLYLSGSLTASLQQGYLLVGGANGKTYAYPTASFITEFETGSLLTTASFNAYTQSNDTKWSNLAAQSGSWITESETGSFARWDVNNPWSAPQTFTTISASNALITNLHTVYETSSVIYSSGSNQFGDELTDTQILSGSVFIRGGLTINGLDVTASLNSINTFTASTAISINNLNASSASQQISIDALNVFTASQSTASIVTSITNLNSFTQSANVSFTNLNSATASLFTSASLGLTTASLSGQILTFTKGNNSTFAITIPDVSGSDISALNQATASLQSFTASAASSITNLNTFTASANSRLNNLETATSSYAISASVAAVDAAQQAQINSLIAATGSYVTETESGSFLITASFDNGSRNLTFTKGDASTFAVNIPDVSGSAGNFVTTSSFNAYTASNDQRVTSLEANSASVNISVTNLNSFTQSYYTDSASFDTRIDNLEAFSSSLDLTYVTQAELASATGALEISISKKLDTASFNAYTASTDNRLTNIESTTASLNISVTNINSFTSSANQRLTAIETVSGSWITEAESGSFLVTSSINDNNHAIIFTKGNNTTYVNGGFAATGSGNTFTAIQTFQDAGLNATSLVSTSGSLMWVAKSYTSASAHLSASAGTFVNIIFKDNNNTADTIISGSGNLFVNPAAPTAGFKRFVGTTGNIALNASNITQVSASMAFPITMNNNYFGGNGTAMAIRGPISSSAWTIAGNNIAGTVSIGTAAATHAQSVVAGTNMTVNIIPGQLSVIGNQTGTNFGTALTIGGNFIAGAATLSMTGSAIQFSNNIINDTGTIISNGYWSGSLGTSLLAVNRNNFAGQTQTIIVSGSFPAGAISQTPSYSDNAMFGGDNTIFTNVSAAPITSSRALHSCIRTIFAGHQLIATGSSNLLVADTVGSFFAGRWNANDGIRNRTGQNVLVVGTGKSNTNRKTGFLIDSGSNTYVEGTLNVSGSTSTTGSITIQSGSGDLYVHGHKQFQCGAWQDTTTQSGSADTAYAFKFNTVDVLDGVILSGSTGLQPTAAGIYNIQWSGQLSQGAAAGDVTIWLRKNGTDVTGTSGRVSVASNTKLLPAWNYLLELAANDVIELMWGSTSPNTTWEAIPAATIYPAASSIIATITQAR